METQGLTYLPGPWQCGVCLGDLEDEKPIIVGDNTMCLECGRTQLAERFKTALANEFEPARWGEIILDANDFPGLMDPEFMTKWRAKRTERDVPLKERVYCRHRVPDAEVEAVATSIREMWLQDGEPRAGVVTKLTEECASFLCARSYDTMPLLVSCKRCHGMVCCSCKATIGEKEAHDYCNPEKSPAVDEVFSEMRRGRHWQQCPKCSLRVERGAGCNHMTCPSCRQEFCAICGIPAKGDSGHWQRAESTCPIYNYPEDANAQFEEDLVVDESDESDTTDLTDDDSDGYDEWVEVIDSLERDVRAQWGDAHFHEFDTPYLTDVMANAMKDNGSPSHEYVIEKMVGIRLFYFISWAGPNVTDGILWTYCRSSLCIYRILGALVQLHYSLSQPGWDVQVALREFRSYCEELDRIGKELEPLGEEARRQLLGVDTEAFTMRREEAARRLNALAQTEAGKPH